MGGIRVGGQEQETWAARERAGSGKRQGRVFVIKMGVIK